MTLTHPDTNMSVWHEYVGNTRFAQIYCSKIIMFYSRWNSANIDRETCHHVLWYISEATSPVHTLLKIVTLDFN
jgi:hypothetical protein